MTANDIFVINGFYASMRSKYTASAASIYYYVVQWDAAALSWAEFRASVLGATDPEKAQSGSMREQVCARWQELGLAAKPDVGDNGVHGSASPFEGLSERLNWLGGTVDEDETALALMAAGVKKPTLLSWTKDPQVEVDGASQSLFDTFEDMDIGPMLKMAQKVGGDPFEDTPKFSKHQAFVFIKPHAVTDGVKALVKSILRARSMAIVGEGAISSAQISKGKLIDTHYYAIANKASLSKPVELNPPAEKLAEFTAKFGTTWSEALAQGLVYNAVDGCDVLGVDGEKMNEAWALAKARGDLLKFGGGFYVGKLGAGGASSGGAVVPSAGDILAELPKSIYGGFDSLALSNGEPPATPPAVGRPPSAARCRCPARLSSRSTPPPASL